MLISECITVHNLSHKLYVVTSRMVPKERTVGGIPVLLREAYLAFLPYIYLI